MSAAQLVDSAARVDVIPVSTCDQALSLQIEWRQDAASLPKLGGARRETGVAEADLLAAGGSVLAAALLRFEETTRPDGIDLDLLTPKAADAIAAPPSDFLGIAWRRGRKHALGETAVDLTARR
jgi:hypothetical protein